MIDISTFSVVCLFVIWAAVIWVWTGEWRSDSE